MTGLDVVFDASIDRGAWPGPSASAGEVWLGPLGMLDRLELELGLPRRHPTPLERAASLAAELRTRDGFWSRSSEVDPLASAERMLTDRDLLAMSGWRGEPASERLGALWSATEGVAGGMPDRLARVCASLVTSAAAIARVRVFEPIVTLPRSWREVFAALARAGTTVEMRALAIADAAGDLAAARNASFEPVGDGRITLLRSHGTLAAAEEVAAGLAAAEGLADTVVIGSDATLSSAFERHGLPRLGAASPAGTATLLRLCLETAFRPMNATDLHALLCVDPSPIPRRVGWRLAQALGRFPGRGNAAWREALAKGLEAVAVDRRDEVAQRIAALVAPEVARDTRLPIDRVLARVAALSSWAQARSATTPSLRGVVIQATAFVSLARGYREGLGLPDVRRLCTAILPPEIRIASAQSGIATVADPGALLGPARRVIWWDFTRGRAAVVPRLRLSNLERSALAARGVVVPDPGESAAIASRRWRRPLIAATEALTLVCPRTNPAGEPAFPHPWWDELVAAAPRVARLERAAWPSPRTPAIARALPVPIETARVAAAVIGLGVESASSLERMLGCSFAYALRFAADLRRGIAAPAVEPGPLLSGQIAHHVLAQVFGGGALGADHAATLAVEIFDRELPELAETLLLAEHHAERVAVRRAIRDAARVAGDAIARSGASVRGVEMLLQGTLDGVAVASRADLLVSSPDHVIDYKWGTSSNRKRLADGTAVQLAIYAELARIGDVLPGAAYLTLRAGRLLATSGSSLAGAQVATAHTTETMLRAVRAALGVRGDELARGSLVASGALSEPRSSRLVEGVLELAPPCTYCEYDELCGRRGRT